MFFLGNDLNFNPINNCKIDEKYKKKEEEKTSTDKSSDNKKQVEKLQALGKP